MTRDDVMAAVLAGDTERVNALLGQEASWSEARDAQGVSALMHAIYRRRPDLAARLRAARVRIDVFEAAALGATAALAERLRENPAAARESSSDGFTPLHLAAYFGGVVCASLLLAAGADADVPSRNPMQVRPLHSAVSSGRADVTALVLGAGADPNAGQQQDLTALMQAAHAGSEDLAEMLLAHGADPAKRDASGKTARDYAAGAGHAALAARLALATA